MELSDKSKASQQDNDVVIIKNIANNVETMNGSKKQSSVMQEPLVSNESAMDQNQIQNQVSPSSLQGEPSVLF